MGVRPGAGLDEVLAEPAAQPRQYTSPSGAAKLIECPLRVAYDSEQRGGKPWGGSPSTRLGNVCHAVLEDAANNVLGSAEDAAWSTKFEMSWRRSLEKECGEIARLANADDWLAPEHWPYYALRRAGTKRVARQLCAEIEQRELVCAAEESQQSRDGLIRGRPDLVVRAPVHEVRDYKTGDVHDAVTGQVRSEYQTQVLLYAVLEEATTGRWPSRGVLVPIQGPPAEVTVDAESASREAIRASEALAAYNRDVDAGVGAESLGRPGPSQCRFCPHAPRCPAFWGAISGPWADEGVRAVGGQVTSVRFARRGAIALTVESEAGTFEESEVTVGGVDPARFPLARRAEPGDVLTAVGLRSRQPGWAEPGGLTRMALAPATGLPVFHDL